VVKASITGSIIGNVLLVLGLSILFGGVRHKEQYFNRTGARTSVVSLSLAAIGLIIPTVFHLTAYSSPAGWSPLAEQKLSLGIAIVLFLTYFCVLGFSLRTHKYFFQCGEQDIVESSTQWSRGRALLILLISTAVVALLSEFLVGTIENVDAAKSGNKFLQTVANEQKLKTTTQQTIKIMGQSIAQSQEMEFVFSWNVKDVDPGKIVLTQKIEACTMKMTLGGNEVKYDSTAKDAAENPLSSFFKPIIGSELYQPALHAAEGKHEG
jgi:Ca2+/Na+ antiporter